MKAVQAVEQSTAAQPFQQVFDMLVHLQNSLSHLQKVPEQSFNPDNTESQILQSSALKMYRENDESKSHPVSQSSPFAELVRNILAGLTESVSRIFDRDRWLLFKYIIF